MRLTLHDGTCRSHFNLVSQFTPDATAMGITETRVIVYVLQVEGPVHVEQGDHVYTQHTGRHPLGGSLRRVHHQKPQQRHHLQAQVRQGKKPP